jgi:hypothetical protein
VHVQEQAGISLPSSGKKLDGSGIQDFAITRRNIYNTITETKCFGCDGMKPNRSMLQSMADELREVKSQKGRIVTWGTWLKDSNKGAMCQIQNILTHSQGFFVISALGRWRSIKRNPITSSTGKTTMTISNELYSVDIEEADHAPRFPTYLDSMCQSIPYHPAQCQNVWKPSKPCLRILKKSS